MHVTNPHCLSIIKSMNHIPFYKKLFLSLIHLLLAASLFAQDAEEPTPSPADFLTELEVFMTASKRKILEDAFKEFDKYYSSGVLLDEEKAQIETLANKIIDLKLTASPYMTDLFSCVYATKKSGDGITQFKEWTSVIDEMFSTIENRKVNPIKDFLAFSTTFYSDKALKYSKSGINWKHNTDTYKVYLKDKLPYVKFDKTDIIGIRKTDSIKIEGTKGEFNINELKWYGTGGKVQWRNESMEEVYAELNTYEIDGTKALYTAKNAKLYYNSIFPTGPIQGTFTDKVSAQNMAKGGSYPRFVSLERLKISDLGAGISFEGNFGLQGKTIYGTGSNEFPANVKLSYDGKKLINSYAEQYVIQKDVKLVSEQTTATLYMGQDTIFHPSINLVFKVPDKIISISRGERATDQNPFLDSYHTYTIDAPSIDWLIDKDSILFGKERIGFAKSIKKRVIFESPNFYNEQEYFKLQNVASSNPLAKIKVLVERDGTRYFDGEYLAQELNPKYSLDNIKSLLYDLVEKGFINYDSDKNEIEVKEKVIQFVDAAADKIDYDVLKIISETDSTNASLDLRNNIISADGVKRIEFSEKQKVAAKPFFGKVQMHKNRSVFFDGRVFAGYSLFTGKEFTFDYDKFNIRSDSIRFFDLFIPTGVEDEKGNKEALSIASRIEHATGFILIDAPNNKSGRENIPTFPSFQSKGNSYVYYDNLDTKNGVYGRDSFYFKLDKFSFNSLDDYTIEDVIFKGNMYSFDIMPVFEESLVVREEDQSLGFVTQTPDTGYEAYAGKGKYTGELDLSNAGLLGKGIVNYLNASIDSEDIVFMPKQMLCSAETFDMEEVRSSDLEIPQVHGEDVKVNWRPYRDSLYINSKEEPFEFFKKPGYTLDGTLILTPDGVKGNGKFEWEEGILNSKLLEFQAFKTYADTSSIKIKALEGEGIAFDTKNVNSDVDFDMQMGTFKANVDSVMTRLPLNKYETTMNEFVWDMAKKHITFITEPGKMGSFISTDSNRDSLNFEGLTGFYDLNTSQLEVGGINFIKSADALIYPDSNYAVIRPGGAMMQLNNAQIIANDINKYHVINRATVNIKGAKEYKASGFYEYNIGDKEQEIEFTNIIGQPVGKGKRSEKKTVTRAIGEIAADTDFKIDVKTNFQGAIGLNAESRNLIFKGYAQMDAVNLPKKSWFSIDCMADKNDMLLPFNDPKDFDGQPLKTGLFLSKEAILVYPSVMTPLYYRKDRAILDVSGYMKYNGAGDEFILGDSMKITGLSPRGNMLNFADKTGDINAEGSLNLCTGLPDLFKIKAAGQMQTNIAQFADTTSTPQSLQTKMDVMAGILFEIPDKLKKIMLQDLVSTAFTNSEVNFEKDNFYTRAVAEFIPDDNIYTNIISKMRGGVLEIPKKYNDFLFLFARMPMKWDVDYQSFISVKDKNFVISVDGQNISRRLTSYVEFKMPSNNDDRLYILIKAPNDYYYFFGYKQGILNTVSNNSRYNDEVVGMKDKERVVKNKKYQYEIQPVNPGTATNFINRIKAGQN